MLIVTNGVVDNDDNPWSQNIIKDSKDGLHYEILWDNVNSDVYVTSTLSEPIDLDLIDSVTNITYRIFVYDTNAFLVPIKNSLNEINYGKDCFVPSGSTILINIERNSDEITDIADISTKIYNKDTDEYLFLDTTIEEVQVNLFKISFIIPFKGNFLTLIKINKSGTDIYLNKDFSVYQYTYEELLSELLIVQDNLNVDESKGFV